MSRFHTPIGGRMETHNNGKWVEGKHWEEAKKSGNDLQAAGHAEVKFMRVFRVGEIWKFPFIRQRKSLGIIEGSTSHIPMKHNEKFIPII